MRFSINPALFSTRMLMEPALRLPTATSFIVIQGITERVAIGRSLQGIMQHRADLE